MMQSPPTPSAPSLHHSGGTPHHHPGSTASAAASAVNSPFFAAFSTAGLRPLEAATTPGGGTGVMGGLALHPAFLHPLYPLPPGLASLRAAAAAGTAGLLAAAAAATGNNPPTTTGNNAATTLNISSSSSSSSPASPDRNKSFTIDAILGKEDAELGRTQHQQQCGDEDSVVADGSNAASRNRRGSRDSPVNAKDGFIKVETVTSSASSAFVQHQRLVRDAATALMSGGNGSVSQSVGVLAAAAHHHHHSHHRSAPPAHHPHAHHHAVARLHGTGPAPTAYPHLHGTATHLPGTQLTCAPGFTFRHHPHHHHHHPYIRDKVDKKSLGGGAGGGEWKAGKTKRVRTIFTPEQLERMEAEFERQQYMVGTERYYLAASLNLTEAQVKVWFQNRRIKWRKQNLEQQHAKLAKLDLLAKHPDDQDADDDDDDDDGLNSDSDLSDTCLHSNAPPPDISEAVVTGDPSGVCVGNDKNMIVPTSSDQIKPPVSSDVMTVLSTTSHHHERYNDAQVRHEPTHVHQEELGGDGEVTMDDSAPGSAFAPLAAAAGEMVSSGSSSRYPTVSTVVGENNMDNDIISRQMLISVHDEQPNFEAPPNGGN